MISSSILALVANLEDIRGEKFDMQKGHCVSLVVDRKTFNALAIELAGLVTEEKDGKISGLAIDFEVKD